MTTSFVSSQEKGFTLIELILVAAIFGILAAGIIALTDPRNQYLKANDARRKSDLAQIQRSLEAYYHDYGSYPESSADRKIRVGGTSIEWGSSWQPYMNVLPADPTGERRYVYYSTPDRQTYALYASLERGGKDPDACNKGNACLNMTARFGIPSTACSVNNDPNIICNYGVTSSDYSP